MPRAAQKTRDVTLYRLTDIPPTTDGMFDALAPKFEEFDARRLALRELEIHGHPGLLFVGSADRGGPDWLEDLTIMTGLDLSGLDLRRKDVGALMLVAIGEAVLAIGFGGGWRFVPDHLKEPRFGLRYALRTIDSETIQKIERRVFGAGGRTDSTLAPGGLPVWQLGMNRHAEIVGHICGPANDTGLTLARKTGRPVKVFGSTGLRLGLGVAQPDLISDLRNILHVCATGTPAPRLAFMEDIQPITHAPTVSRIEAALETKLRSGEATSALSPVVPVSLSDDFTHAAAYTLDIGRAIRRVGEISVANILTCLRFRADGTWIRALANGHIDVFADEGRTQLLCRTRALDWVEAQVSLGPRRFFLYESQWYEVAAGYLARHRAHVEEILNRPSSFDLIGWDLSRDEKAYNIDVGARDPRFLNLDRKNVRTTFHRLNGVEICDLLGPAYELVHVKRAHSSGPLSHLFSQALVAVEALAYSPDAALAFSFVVHREANRFNRPHRVPEDFRPAKVVFAILLKDGEPLTVDTLFPFSQITLSHVVSTLEERGIAVEVIGIKPAVSFADIQDESA